MRAMAMERRRYVPSTEGLEGRAMLASLFGGSGNNNTSLTTTIDTLPENFKQKELRILHLPFFLGQLQPGRFLPSATVKSIQGDIQQVVGHLHAPRAGQADAFNLDLRHLFPQENLSPDNAKILNHSLGVVLVGAGTSPATVQSFRSDMNELALVDSKSIEGSQLAAQDYSLVLQTALAVGRPILTPSAPLLALKDGIRVDNGVGGITRKPEPTLVGTYTEGASTAQSTVMQVVDQAGDVFGAGTVDKNGTYSVPLTVPLAPGKYRLSVRAVEPLLLISAPSKPMVLKVLPPRHAASQILATPGGPLNLKG
jgi:hypothetical protein